MKSEDIQMNMLREQKKANEAFEKMVRNLTDIDMQLKTMNQELYNLRVVLDDFKTAIKGYAENEAE